MRNKRNEQSPYQRSRTSGNQYQERTRSGRYDDANNDRDRDSDFESEYDETRYSPSSSYSRFDHGSDYGDDRYESRFDNDGYRRNSDYDNDSYQFQYEDDDFDYDFERSNRGEERYQQENRYEGRNGNERYWDSNDRGMSNRDRNQNAFTNSNSRRPNQYNSDRAFSRRSTFSPENAERSYGSMSGNHQRYYNMDMYDGRDRTQSSRSDDRYSTGDRSNSQQRGPSEHSSSQNKRMETRDYARRSGSDGGRAMESSGRQYEVHPDAEYRDFQGRHLNNRTNSHRSSRPMSDQFDGRSNSFSNRREVRPGGSSMRRKQSRKSQVTNPW
jgi:hypothetical protein